MKKGIQYAACLMLLITLCGIMVDEGKGQYLDEDKYKISLKYEKEGKYYGVEGTIEHKQKPFKAELFAGANFKDALTGDPIDLRLRLDLLAGDLTFKGVAELYDISGDTKTDVRAHLTYTLFDYGSIVGTLIGDARWIDGNMVTGESIFKLSGAGWGELGVSRDWVTKETKFFLGISIPWSPEYGQNISGTTVYGNPLAPRFKCTISGNLITTQKIPAFTVVTSLTNSINETDPSGIISEGTSQREIGVGGIAIPINKFGLLAPYIGLASTIIVATAATAIYAKRVKHRKEKQ